MEALPGRRGVSGQVWQLLPRPACHLVRLAVEPVSRLTGRNIANASPDPGTSVPARRKPLPRRSEVRLEHGGGVRAPPRHPTPPPLVRKDSKGIPAAIR
jgi:hypothetical protein